MPISWLFQCVRDSSDRWLKSVSRLWKVGQQNPRNQVTRDGENVGSAVCESLETPERA